MLKSCKPKVGKTFVVVAHVVLIQSRYICSLVAFNILYSYVLTIIEDAKREINVLRQKNIHHMFLDKFAKCMTNLSLFKFL